MMRKNEKKALVLFLVLAMLIGCAIGGTFAWLQFSPDPVLNTFTAGKVEITLQEHVLNPETGKQVDPEQFTYTGNTDIKMVPGRVIEKDPFVTVLAGSEACYVRVFVEVGWTEDADSEFAKQEYDEWITFDSRWQKRSFFDGSFAHNGVYVGKDIIELWCKVEKSSTDTVLPVFNSLNVPADLDKDATAALEDCYIKLTAQAVQAETFASADEAFDAVNIPESVVYPTVNKPDP